MSDLIAYVNGEFTPLAEARLSVLDLAVLRGYGVFDFLRTYHGRPFRLWQHLARLQQSAQMIGLEIPAPVSEIEAIVDEVVTRNGLPEANIRIVVTGGVSPDSISPAEQAGLLVLLTPARQYPADYYQDGIKAITYKTERYLPAAKTINYIPAILALKQAKAANAQEALYVNQQDEILEGTTTNIFLFHGQQLITPKDDILPGVTRDVILELAADHFDVVERPLRRADILAADEAFITASNKEVMPVRRIDEHLIGEGQPGPHTRTLVDLFRQLTRHDFEN